MFTAGEHPAPEEVERFANGAWASLTRTAG